MGSKGHGSVNATDPYRHDSQTLVKILKVTNKSDNQSERSLMRTTIKRATVPYKLELSISTVVT